MASILQGTTPSITFNISEDDFAVTDVTKLELTFSNDGNTVKKALDAVALDAVANSITYTFTEAETLALVPSARLYYQLRFGFQDGSIVGTPKASLNVSDLISEEAL